MLGPLAVFGGVNRREGGGERMRGGNVKGVVMGKPMIDIPISQLTR